MFLLIINLGQTSNDGYDYQKLHNLSLDSKRYYRENNENVSENLKYTQKILSDPLCDFILTGPSPHDIFFTQVRQDPYLRKYEEGVLIKDIPNKAESSLLDEFSV